MADVQMHAMKMVAAELSADKKLLVTEGIFRLAQNPNWFGDYLRYTAFGMASGGYWTSFIPLVLGMMTNMATAQDPTTKGGLRDRYGAEIYDEWITNAPNKFVPAVPSDVAIVMVTIGFIWAISFVVGYYYAGGIATTTSTKKKVL